MSLVDCELLPHCEWEKYHGGEATAVKRKPLILLQQYFVLLYPSKVFFFVSLPPYTGGIETM